MSRKYDLGLSDGKSNKKFVLTLDGDNAIQESSVSEDKFAMDIRNVGKKFGDFDEQRNWKGGFGSEYFNDNPEAFFDSQNCWTLSEGSLMPTLQMKFAKDVRDQDFVMPGDVRWVALTGQYKKHSVSFVASSTYEPDNLYIWIRRIGSPTPLRCTINSDSSGEPGDRLNFASVNTTDITDVVSELYNFKIGEEFTFKAGRTYHIVLTAGADSRINHWEVGFGTHSGLKSSANTWSTSNIAMYYRVTDTDRGKIYYPFSYRGGDYVVTTYDGNVDSELFINGYRGKVSSATNTGGKKTGKPKGSTLAGYGTGWITNMWDGAWVKISYGTGKGQSKEIQSNTQNTLVMNGNWDIVPDETSVYVIYGTDRFAKILGHGLTKVYSAPCISEDMVHFPQGTSVAVRRMYYDWQTGLTQFAADPSDLKFNFMVTAQDPKDGSIVWGCSRIKVQRSKITQWQGNFNFEAEIQTGSSEHSITGLLIHESLLYVFKEDSVWTVTKDKAYQQPFGIEATPHRYNGQASASHNLFLYFNWLWSTERLYSGTLDDIGKDWSGIGLPEDRQGFITKYEPAVGWLFASVDAGNDGTSSVLCFDGLFWHEVLRGFKKGARARWLKWQPVDGGRHRLWTSLGSDLVYQEFPLNTANPLNDPYINYQHEGVLISSTIDMGSASRLPKYIKGLTLLSKNLSDRGMNVELSYQYDDDIGTSTWIDVIPGFLNSPEQELILNLANIRQFRYRIRLITDDSDMPVVVKSVVPSGFARVPYRRVWHIRVKTGEIYDRTGRKSVDAKLLKKWLRDNAKYP